MFAQTGELKIGYVDSQVILAQFPAAIKAQGDLDALTGKWGAHIDSLTQDLQKAYGDYQKQHFHKLFKAKIPVLFRIEEKINQDAYKLSLSPPGPAESVLKIRFALKMVQTRLQSSRYLHGLLPL